MLALFVTAGLLLAATCWGTAAWRYGLPYGGEIRPNPFSDGSLRLTNLLYTMPHRALQTMPYVPVGARGTLTLRPRVTDWINSPGFPGGAVLIDIRPSSTTIGIQGSLFSPISQAYAAAGSTSKPCKEGDVWDEKREDCIPEEAAVRQRQPQQQTQKQQLSQEPQQQQQQQQQQILEEPPAKEQRAEPILPPLPEQVEPPAGAQRSDFFSNPPPAVGRNPNGGSRLAYALDGSCVTADLCLLVGEGGMAALTKDGGLTWLRADYVRGMPQEFDFLGALPPRESQGVIEAFAISNSGFIMRLEATPEHLILPPQTALSAISQGLLRTDLDLGNGPAFLLLLKRNGQAIRATFNREAMYAGLYIVTTGGRQRLTIGPDGVPMEADPFPDSEVFQPVFITPDGRMRLEATWAGDRGNVNGLTWFDEGGSGWAVGDFGALVKLDPSAEAGDPLYAKIQTPTGANLRNIRFAAPPPGEEDGQARLGWVTSGWFDGNEEGDRPVVLQTLDGGASWERLSYRHWPAPWVFLTGFLAAAAGVRGASARRRYLALKAFLEQQARIAGSVATTDKPIGWDDDDVIGLKPIAKALSLFIRNRDTEPPVSFGITGAWGTGKSSLMHLVAEDLRGHGARPVTFNAWHHQTETHLLAALLETIRAQGVPSWWTLSGLLFRFKLQIGRLGDLKTLLAISFVVALAISMVALVKGLPVTTTLNQLLHPLVVELNTGSLGVRLIKWIAGSLGASGATLMLLFGLLRSLQQLKVITVKPAALMARLSRRAGIAQFEQQLGFRHRFQQEFGQVCKALRGGDSPGMVIFIDDLDRCRPDNVLVVLESVNFLVSAGPCFVVLGIDEEKVIQSVAHGFKDSILVPPNEADRTTELKPSGLQVFQFARNYLEKLINISVPVPVMDAEQSGDLMSQGAAKAVKEGQGAAARKRPEKAGVLSPWPRKIRSGLRFGLDLLGGMVPISVTLFLVFQWIGNLLPPKAADGTTNADARQEGASTEPRSGEGGAQGEQTAADAGPDLNIGAEPTAVADPASLTAVSWWWLIFLLSFAALAVALLFVRRATGLDEAEPRDRQEFKYALHRFLPLIHPCHPTPRAVKRFQNHTRFLAMLLRDPDERRTWLDRLFERAVDDAPDAVQASASQDELEQATIPEEKLVALNALYNFDPKLFDLDESEGRPLLQLCQPAILETFGELSQEQSEAIMWIRDNSSDDEMAAFLALRPTATTVLASSPDPLKLAKPEESEPPKAAE